MDLGEETEKEKGGKRVNQVGEKGGRLREKLENIRVEGDEVKEKWEKMKEIEEILDEERRREKVKVNRGW